MLMTLSGTSYSQLVCNHLKYIDPFTTRKGIVATPYPVGYP